MAILLANALRDPVIITALSQILQQLGRDAELTRALAQLLSQVSEQTDVRAAVRALLEDAVQSALSNQEVCCSPIGFH